LPNKLNALKRLARRAGDLARSRLAERRYQRPAAGGPFFAVLVFAGTPEQLYQLRQWLWPLAQLDAALASAGMPRVAVVVRDVALVDQVRALTQLPVFGERLLAGVIGVAGSSDVVLYVNQATLNFQALSMPGPAHVHLSHGESEKASMVSNQLKAYDAVFTAGPAARQRIAEHLVGFDTRRCIDVGRPQLDEPRSVGRPEGLADASFVLYAPTWEGDSGAMSYSSVAACGLQLVEELVTGGHRVLYRPHPQTGVRSASARKANESIIEFLQSAPGGHLVDRTPTLGWQWDVSSVAVVDLSAMAFDALALRMPLVVVEPADPAAHLVPDGLLRHVVTVDPRSPQLLSALERATAPELVQRVETLAQHYFGDTSPGAQIDRFIDGTLRLGAERAGALARRGRGDGGSPVK